jgi:hypothetical protein
VFWLNEVVAWVGESPLAVMMDGQFPPIAGVDGILFVNATDVITHVSSE